MLNKEVEEIGKVKLVKVDIDKNQELAQQLRIQSVPTVYAFFQGQPIDGFQGALPENEIKKFVNKVVSSSGGEDKEKQVEELLKVAEQKFIDNEIDESFISANSLSSKPKKSLIFLITIHPYCVPVYTTYLLA